MRSFPCWSATRWCRSIAATPAAMHFRLLSVLRDLALETLPAGELDQLRSRHRRWFADRWRRERGRDELFQDVRDHQEDYLQALTSAVDDEDGEAATDLALTLAEYWQLAGARLAGTKWLGLVLHRPGMLSTAGRARLQVQRAVLLQNHDPDQVVADTTDALSVLDPAQDADDAEPVVLAYAVRALERWIAGDPAAAISDADLGVRIASRWGRPFLPRALSTQALLHAVTGDRPTALTAARRAQELLPTTAWASRRLPVALNLALALVNLGQFADAVQVLEDAALDLPPANGRESAAPLRFWVNLGWATLGVGDLDRAWDSFVHSLRRSGPVSPDRESAEVLLGIGCVLSARADPSAGPVLAGARELMRRLAVPMSEELMAAVDRARAPGDTDAGAASSLPDEILVRRLGELVAGVVRRP